MNPPKLFRHFAIRLVLAFGLLLIPWPGLADGYAAMFRSVEQVLLGSVWPRGGAEFARLEIGALPQGYPLPPNVHMLDTVIRLHNRPARLTGYAFNSSRQVGYLSTITLVALVIATPLPWRRKRWALLWGLLFVYAYAFIRVGVYIGNNFSGTAPPSLYVMTASSKGVLDYVARSILPAGTFVVPLVVWILVTFRRADLATLRPAGTASRS
ncbi:MAG: hypothetical protein GY842_08595 [bacterium]|nr:hypothetical protein [bacterium]